MSTRQINAPNSVVRLNKSKIPPRISAQPVKISYAGAAPIEVQSKLLSERLPTGVTNVFSVGRANWTGMTFVMPYSNIEAASATRMNRRNHL
jgi:hypothetical protein